MTILLPHLETNITIACTLRCVGCNHYVGMQSPAYVNPQQVERDLGKLRTVAHAEKYALIGGEPLMHKRIVDILRIAKGSEISDHVEVWTNGMLARRMKEDFWMMVDGLVVSLYPGKLSDADIEYIADKCADYGVALEWKDMRRSSYFTQLLYRETATPEQAHARYRQCWYKSYCHVVDNGFFYRCCTTPFVPKLILGLPEGTDGLPLDGITEEALQAFLKQDETPISCTRCAAHNGRHIEWREERDPAKWLEASMG
jgi:organic radical activating enzyme